jgi:glucose/arabinose dehydrogenase
LAAGVVLALAAPAAAQAVDPTYPAGFRETVAYGSLTFPMDVDNSPDGRVFVAEKSGKNIVYSGPDDRNPSVFADLSEEVYDFWDRGLMSIALDPGFPDTPYVYALYAADLPPGGTPMHWYDECPTPPGPTDDGCVISGRLAKLKANGDAMTGDEQVLIEDWCQQFPSHSLGDLAFDSEGALYISGGEGASWEFPDYGQDRGNPCGDPLDEGGALRSQDLLTRPDPTGLSGSVLRVDPDTGAAWPSNPLILDDEANARRIIAHGLRNPF